MVHLAPLQREGIEIWVDNDLIPGDELDPTIRRALRRADIFVALASPDDLHSRLRTY
ncbi:TIR domain-containing protein [Sphingomonas bacterium]|uniref:TIR domain-containing protein n=1 Tax=Sphingomonas bacterium TaxID=1895847 RepID=UPI001576757D